MKAAGFFFGALAVLLLFISVARPILLAAALPLLAIAVVLLHLWRPPEQHLGVIFRMGRLWRFTDPDAWCLLLPLVDRLGAPVDLRQRLAHSAVQDTLTHDRVPVDISFTVIYRRDLREAGPAVRYQALSWPEEAWGQIIETFLTEAAVAAAGAMAYDEMLTPEGREALRSQVNERILPAARRMGAVIDPQHGVNIKGLRAASPIWEAQLASKAADAQGDATARYVRPLLDEAVRRPAGAAHDAYLLHLAAAVSQEGRVPQIVLTPDDLPHPAEAARTPGLVER